MGDENNALKDYGFGTDADDADTSKFESNAVGGNPGETEADEKELRDDGSDNAGWDAPMDTKDLSGPGKEPEKDDDGLGDDEPEKKDEKKAEPKDKEKPADKAKDDEGDDDKGDDELPEGIKRRISRAQRQRNEAEAERVRLDAENAELRKQLAAKDKPADTAEPPKAEDFDDYEEYLEAKKAHETKAKEPEKKEPPKQEAKPDRELVSAVTELKAVLTEAGHGAIFDSVVAAGQNVPIPRDVVLALSDPDTFDHPETVLQALLDDPANAIKLAEMTPARRMKHLVKMDLPFKAKDEEKPKDKAPPRRQSGAPDPIDNTNGNTGQVTDYATMDFDDFETRRNEEAARRKDFW